MRDRHVHLQVLREPLPADAFDDDPGWQPATALLDYAPVMAPNFGIGDGADLNGANLNGVRRGGAAAGPASEASSDSSEEEEEDEVQGRASS